jgi:hypothetical protein
MNFSALSAMDKRVAILAAVVAVTAVLSLALAWGFFMVISLVAGAAALWVVFQPQVTPAMKLPGSKGSLVTAAGAVATVAAILAALPWLTNGYIGARFLTFDVIQFMVGLIASVLLAWTGWQMLSGEGGKFQIGSGGGSGGGTQA